MIKLYMADLQFFSQCIINILPYRKISQFSSVQSLSCVRLFANPWIAARQASLSITNSRSSPRLTSVMPSSHLILCRPLLLPHSIFPSIRVYSSESVLCIRWPKYWSFSFSISPSNEYSGLISFRMDWLDLLAVQGTLKSLLQHHRSKASILQHSGFFTVQLSYPFMTTGKTIALTWKLTKIFVFCTDAWCLSINLLPLLCLEGVPDLPVAPQDEAGLTKTFQTWPRGWFHIP